VLRLTLALTLLLAGCGETARRAPALDLQAPDQPPRPDLLDLSGTRPDLPLDAALPDAGLPDQPGSSVPQVPYFYQYDNQLYPSSTCQNTSIAMVLAYLGWSGKPDDITAAHGKDKAQSPSGLAAVFNSYAQSMGIAERLVPHMDGTVQDVRSLLAAGTPVIVHGYFTAYGHVLVILAESGADYVVHDPAGKWSEVFKGGYGPGQSATSGKAVSYGAAAFEAAIATLDGATFEPIWYHELR